MIKTFLAADPGRYVQPFQDDQPTREIAVEAYKMIVNFETRYYDSFCKLRGGDHWIQLSKEQYVTNMQELWNEIAGGYLIDEPEGELQ